MATSQDFEARRRERLQRQRKQRQRMKMIQAVLSLVLLVLIVVIIVTAVSKCSSGKPNTDGMNAVSATAVPYVSESPTPAAETADMMIPSPSEGKNDILDVIKDSGQKKHVYLTFDEGPDNKVTAQILDVLRRYNVKATFFMIGENIEKSPQMCTRVIQEGHLAAPLSYSADYDTLYADKDDFIAEIEKTYQLIAECTPGNKEMFRIMRFPGGSYDEAGYGFSGETFKNALARSGFYFADWNCTVGDSSSQRNADSLLNYFTQNRPQLNNLVIKLHDSSANSATAEMLDKLVKQLLDEGYTFSRLDEIDFSNSSQVTGADNGNDTNTAAPASDETQASPAASGQTSDAQTNQTGAVAPTKTAAPVSGSSSSGSSSQTSQSGSSSSQSSSSSKNTSSSKTDSSSASSSSGGTSSGNSSAGNTSGSSAVSSGTQNTGSSSGNDKVLDTE